MCVALPGIVKKIEKDRATVDFNGNVVEARAGLVPVEVGDRVLVHAGCIIQKITKQDAEEMEKIFFELQ